MSCADPFHCVTCADEGVAMRVVAVDEERGLALCAAPGDLLLVHAGTALAALDPAEAGA